MIHRNIILKIIRNFIEIIYWISHIIDIGYNYYLLLDAEARDEKSLLKCYKN